MIGLNVYDSTRFRHTLSPPSISYKALMKGLAGLRTGCHFEKAWKFLALPRPEASNRRFSESLRRPTIRNRGSTKFTLITCLTRTVKPFLGLVLDKEHRIH